MAIAVAGALTATASTPEASGTRHRVEIRRFRFEPGRLVAAPGDTVVWVNRDLVPHTVTARNGRWDSQFLEASKVWDLRVSEEMTGEYFCRYHPGMTGHLRVQRKERAYREGETP